MPMSAKRNKGELFYEDAHGRKRDAEIHDRIISSADPNGVAKHHARSKARLAKNGMNPETIKRLMG